MREEEGMHSASVLVSTLGLLLLWLGRASAAAEEPSRPPKYFLLPIEFDFDRGAGNGDAMISRLLPVNSIPVSDKWRLMNIAIVTLANAPGGVPGRPGNPDPVPGDTVFGLSDFADAILITPNKARGALWGVGALLGFPTATDGALGSGKWSAGPAVRIAHQSGPWRFALLAGTRWSFAGDEGRADISQLMMRGLVRRRLPNNWFFVYSPIITANWNASSGQKWLVPLGGGIGKRFPFKTTSVNVSFQAYVNAVKPDGAPDTVFRIAFVVPFVFRE